MKPDDTPDGNPNKIEITIIYNGIPKALEVNLNQSLQAVFNHALTLFGSPSGQLGLFTQSNAQLDMNQSVSTAGVTAGATLLLRPLAVRAG